MYERNKTKAKKKKTRNERMRKMRLELRPGLGRCWETAAESHLHTLLLAFIMLKEIDQTLLPYIFTSRK